MTDAGGTTPTYGRRSRPGAAAAALGVILVVTVAWWALALWPAAAAPDWLSRTRLACFGAEPGGLPDAGGWVLLVGEPLGMLGVLVAVWGGALRRDLRALSASFGGKAILGITLAGLAWGALAAAMAVKRIHAASSVFAVNDTGVSSPVLVDVPPLVLIDQHGQRFDLATLKGKPVLVTFAFAHCETMCPTLVRDVQRVRRDAGRNDVPIVIVTVDPWRDVPSRLANIAAAWELRPGDRVLSGLVGEVNAALDAWGVARNRNTGTGDVVHTMVVVLVDEAGRRGLRVDGGPDGLSGVL
jgi:cytochrome oxidase Cu insertion factor (SCO1/SenC/PrrC family)